jgi:cytidine deaminase
VTDSDRELLERADGVAARAYAPYSQFFVGAAVRTADGTVIEGVNVENAAYPLGICAERATLARAISDGYRPGDFETLAVTASPCGGCRQWLVEMKVSRVVYRNARSEAVVATPAELLPDTFELD